MQYAQNSLFAALMGTAGVAQAAISPMATELSEPHPTITDSYHHVSWTSKDGAPAGIWTIRQTTDGWLWLGSASGLYRFDGVSFEHIDLLPGDSLEWRSIRSMLATSDGSLWVIFASGRIARLGASDRNRPIWLTGMPSDDRVVALDQDGSGNIWAYTASSNVLAVQGSELRPLGAGWTFPAGRIQGTAVDSLGNYWVGTSTGLYVRQKGAQNFARSLASWSKDADIRASQGGQMWVVQDKNYRLFEGLETPPSPSKNPNIRQFSSAPYLLTREGSWWSVDCLAGICRGWPSSQNRSVPFNEFENDVFARKDGLSSDRGMTLYEDRERNIWVGTKQGLDQFYKNDFVSVRFPTRVGYLSMASDAESGIWIGSDVRIRFTEDFLWKVDPQPHKVAGFSEALHGSFEDSDGNAFFGGREFVWRLSHGKMERTGIPILRPQAQFQTLVLDGTGHLWASFVGDGTFRFDEKNWTLKGGLAQMHDGMATVAARDDQGRLWLGFRDNVVTRIDGDQVINLTVADGLSIGPVTAMSMGEPVLFGGEFGIDMLIDGRLVALHTDHPESMKAISGIVRTRNGDLWINGSGGAVKINAVDFDHAVKEPGYSAPSRVFNAYDGLPAGAQNRAGDASLIQDKQGKLWFATEDGLAWLQPEDIQSSPEPPNVEILSLSIQGYVFAATPQLMLPAGTQNLAINYTALSLKNPQRVQFRFRLSGVDKEWRSIGNLRSANYSNLGPGSYRFQVRAANESGVWNEKNASLEFSIRAAFYQTQWFKAACALAAMLALFVLVRFLTMRTVARAAARMGERMRERERIARELHDTLLQDVQALGLNLRALHMKYDGEGNPVGAELAQLDEAAHRSLEGARARVTGLRTGAEVNELPDVFREFGAQLSVLYSAAIRVDCTGRAVRLHPVAADEIVAIGREALLNAFRHAHASMILVSIVYTPRALEITVADDGRGFSIDHAIKSGTPGHWGLLGMRERARTLKANLDIQTQAPRGTRVYLRVPAAVAFERA